MSVCVRQLSGRAEKSLLRMRRFFGIIALLALSSLTASLALAREASGPARTRLEKEALREAMERWQNGGPVVSQVVVNGTDLVAVLGSGSRVHIEKCVIEGGLVFPNNPVVTVSIELVDCSIEPVPKSVRGRWGGHAVFAEGARFSGGVKFSGTTFQGVADFTSAVFDEQADFSAARFPASAQFLGTKFNAHPLFSHTSFAKADFRNASFQDGVGFGRATFETAAEFAGAVVEKSANFGRATFREPQTFTASFNGLARFKGTRFEGGAAFPSTARFGGNASFESARFGGDASFEEITFTASADFERAAFEKSADFPRANFLGQATFKDAVFQKGANFAAARFGDAASFQSAEFLGESDFSNSHFSEEANFVAARFRSLVSFSSMAAERFASFRGAEFGDGTSLERAVFGESADFQGTTFQQYLIFTNAEFGAYADFRNAKIAKLELYSVRNPTILKSRMDLRGAQIGAAHIQDVIFQDTVDFSDASFGFPPPVEAGQDAQRDATILRFVTFENDVSFARAHFAGRLALENVKFHRTADFTDANFVGISATGGPAFSVSYVDFGDLRISWTQLPETRYWVQSQEDGIRGSIKSAAPPGPPEPISRTLAKLEARFRDQNRLEDANQAYYERKLAELAEARSHGWDARRLLLELEWLFWGLLCGYGTWIGGAIAWALFADLLFALIYWEWAIVTRMPHPGVQQEYSFRLRLLDFPKQYSTDAALLSIDSPQLRKFIDTLRVSSVILFKVGYRDTLLSGSLGPLPLAYVIAFEWALGFYLLAAITITLANTQPLINRLVTGVF